MQCNEITKKLLNYCKGAITVIALILWNRQSFFKNAQKSDFLELCPIWAHLPGNVNFLTRSTRYKSGLVMVKFFRWNFFWELWNSKNNEFCEWVREPFTMESIWEPKAVVRNTFYSFQYLENKVVFGIKVTKKWHCWAH